MLLLLVVLLVLLVLLVFQVLMSIDRLNFQIKKLSNSIRFRLLVTCTSHRSFLEMLSHLKIQVVRQFVRCHSRSTHTIVQNEGTPGIGHPDRGYDLFVTSAVSDGTKMWDVRYQGDECVQKYDSHVHTRHQCGTSVSPCMRDV